MRVCPHCGKHHNAETSIGGKHERIEPGDFGLCISCGEWMVMSQRGLTRKPTDEEYAIIGTDYECQRVRYAWTKFRGSAEG